MMKSRFLQIFWIFTNIYTSVNSDIQYFKQECIDKMTTCDLVVKYNLCNNKGLI